MENKMGKNIQMWRDGEFQSIEFVVTQQCNLRCKYCYMVGKNDANRLTFDVAKKAIDYLISKETEALFERDAISLNFIGGEPLLEIDLIDKICDYFKLMLYESGHKWFNNYMINIGTNGLLYSDTKVQKFLKKNFGRVTMNITIDGNEEKHDLQRVYPNGKGSHSDVLKNVHLWLKQSGHAVTKVTIGHDDLHLIKDSIVYLWNLGMDEVPANIIFEDVWQDGDDEIYCSQLKEIADYVIDNELWSTHNTTLFHERLGGPLDDKDLKGRECGSGGIISIDASGKFYPCVRFIDYSLENQESISVGDIEHGLNLEKIRSFVNCDLQHQSDKECLECPVAAECSYCLAHNYDVSDSGTLFQRNKIICKMHKARVRANNYYWAKLEEKLNEVDTTKCYYKKNLFILLADDSTEYCTYNKKVTDDSEIKALSETQLELASKFAEYNFLNPILVHSNDEELSNNAIQQLKDLRTYNICEVNSEVSKNDSILRRIICLSHNDLAGEIEINGNSVILNLDKDNISNLSSDVELLLKQCKRINLIIKGDYDKIDFSEYARQLDNVVNLLGEYYENSDAKYVDVITDSVMCLEENSCKAGEDSFTLAPNGYIYVCPAFYYSNPSQYIGSIEEGIIDAKLKYFTRDSSPICSNCDAGQCKRCVFENKKWTGEFNTPSSYQCKKSMIERKAAKKLSDILDKLNYESCKCEIDEISSMDPITKLIGTRDNKRSYNFVNIL